MTGFDFTSHKNMRAVFAAAAFFAGWILLAVFHTTLWPGLRVSSIASNLLAISIFAVGVYLVSQNGAIWKILGVGSGLLSVPLIVASERITEMEFTFRKFGFADIFSISHPLFQRSLLNNAVMVLFCLAAVYIVSMLYKSEGKDKVRLCALTACLAYIVFFFVSPNFLLNSLTQMRYFGLFRYKMSLIRILINLLPFIAVFIVLYLIAVSMYSLCNSQKTRVKLHGIGLVWAWLALAGSVVVIVLCLVAGFTVRVKTGIAPTGYLFAFNLLLGISAFTGYLLLIIKKRMGLYVILIGVGLMLGIQLTGTFYYSPLSIRSAGLVLAAIAPSVLGALNPLFAYLAVRAGDK
jgi:hypothetical protein